ANAVMIRSLPVRDPGQLVLFRYEFSGDISAVRRTQVGDDQTTFPYAVYEAVRGRTRTLSGVVAFVPLGLNQQSLTVQTEGQSIVAGGEMVSGNYFQVLGVSPILGRVIVDDDLRPGAPNVAVISHQFWLREFGGDPSVVGRSITVNRLPFMVAGVMPREFFGVNPAVPPDLWISLRDMPVLKPWGRLRPGPGGVSPFADTRYWWCLMIGREQPGMSQRQVLAEVDVLFRETISEGLKERPGANSLPHLALTSARHGLDGLRRSLSVPLRILIASVSLVLLIACANVATLLLARAWSREREVGARLALGASRCRLVQQFLTESMLLSLCGGAAGLLLSLWGSEALVPMLAAAGQPIPLGVQPDLTVFAFAAAISLLTGILFGLVPALGATRVNLMPQLMKSSGRGCSRFILSKILVSGQAALSVFLLFGALLFVRTFLNLENQDLGFNRHNLLLFEIDPRRGGASIDQTVAIYDRALGKIQALPGVQSASISAAALLSGFTDGGPVSIEVPQESSEGTRDVYFNIVGPDFLETMGIPVLVGRGIDWRDISLRNRVAVVNEAVARLLFPNEDPLGRRFSFEIPFDSRNAFEIVGVVKNAKYGGIRPEPPPTAYLPYSTLPERIARMCFGVRTTGDPLLMVPAVRDAMRSVAPALPMIDIRTQGDQINRALEQERMLAGLSSLFGVLALLLVFVGVYGTLAYAVTRRTGEIGIRMALGASPSLVSWMLLREALLLAGCGLVVGLPVALASARLVASRFFGVAAHDGWTILTTSMVLSVAAILAGFLPANRASHIDPIQALRYE
ncbi:MAG TPA: ABC transporter permease, partial [Acidobacteriota bacterium]|nr:ABC transporter permease [Acidobacteriota bacterium]